MKFLHLFILICATKCTVNCFDCFCQSKFLILLAFRAFIVFILVAFKYITFPISLLTLCWEQSNSLRLSGILEIVYFIANIVVSYTSTYECYSYVRIYILQYLNKNSYLYFSVPFLKLCTVLYYHGPDGREFYRSVGHLGRAHFKGQYSKIFIFQIW